MSDSLDPIARLMRTLRERAEPACGVVHDETARRWRGEDWWQDPRGSGGVDRGGQRGAAMTVASTLIYEAGDLIYHTLVLLAWRGVDIDEVAAELARREGTSGWRKRRAAQTTAPRRIEQQQPSDDVGTEQNLRIGLPSKGRLCEVATELLSQAGLNFRRQSRGLFARVSGLPIDLGLSADR